jgi:hypothetical protein
MREAQRLEVDARAFAEQQRREAEAQKQRADEARGAKH